MGNTPSTPVTAKVFGTWGKSVCGLSAVGGIAAGCYLPDTWRQWKAERDEARRQERELTRKQLEGSVAEAKFPLQKDDKHLQNQICEIRTGLKQMRDEVREEKNQQQDEMTKVKADVQYAMDYLEWWEDRKAECRRKLEEHEKKWKEQMKEFDSAEKE